MPSRLTAYIFLLGSSVIWGIAGPVIKHTLQFLPPFNFLFWRFLLTAIFTLPIFLWYIKKHPLKLSWLPQLLVLTIVGTTINLAFVNLGFERTTAIQGTLLTAMTPVFVAIGGVFFLKEHVTRRERFGIGLAIAGTAFSVIEPLLRNGPQTSQNAALGNLILIGYNISWMAYVLLSKKLGKDGPKPFHITSISFLIAPITFLPLALFEKSGLIPFHEIPTAAFSGILYMAAVSGFVGYLFYQIGLSKVETGEADVFNYLHPIWAAPLSILWLGEAITPTFLVGATLIATGVAIAEYRPHLFLLLSRILLKPKLIKTERM